MVKPGYKQTEIGEIPEDWECAMLLDKSKLLNGLTYTPDNVKDHGLFVLRSSNIQNNQLSFEDTLYVDCIVDVEKKIKDGDILICVRNGSAALIGKSAQAQRDYNATFGAFMAVLRGEHNDYIQQILQQGIIQREISKNSGATINQITNGDFKQIRIALPASRDEEVAITTTLSHVDRLISTIEKLITKKKTIKQGAMQELLTGKKRLPGFSGEWNKILLGNISEIKTGDKNNEQKSDVGKYPFFVRSQQVERISSYSFDGEAILVPGEGNIGQIFHYIDGKFDWHQRVYKISNFPEWICGKYIYYQMKFSFGAHALKNTVKATVDSLRLPTFENFGIQVPAAREEQEAIAAILSNMDSEIEALEQKLSKYRLVKQGMMQQLLTGKIRLLNTANVIQQTEPVTSLNGQPQKPAHNRQFEDAVTIAAIVDTFYSDKYPLGRVKVQKLLYLLHRHQAISVSDFKKKAAGPYADTVRYRGGEPIAKKNKYINSNTGKQGTIYFKGENIAQALEYVERWGMHADVEWLKENFSYTSRNDLELFATVDMAMCDLNEAGIPISVASIKSLIASDKEWKAKLKKSFFSDFDIARAIKKCNELFG